MSKLLIRLVLSTLLASQAVVAMAEEGKASLSGYWKHESKPVIVEMTETEGVTNGVVVKVLLPEQADDEAKAKAKKAMGTTIFRQLRLDESSNGWAGRVYSVEKEVEKEVEVALENQDKFQMTVKLGFIPINIDWTRVEKPVGL